MNGIFCFLDEHKLSPEIGAVYDFKDIQQACIDRDNHKTDGKIVINVQ